MKTVMFENGLLSGVLSVFEWRFGRSTAVHLIACFAFVGMACAESEIDDRCAYRHVEVERPINSPSAGGGCEYIAMSGVLECGRNVDIPADVACNSSLDCNGGVCTHIGLCARACYADIQCPSGEFCRPAAFANGSQDIIGICTLPFDDVAVTQLDVDTGATTFEANNSAHAFVSCEDVPPFTRRIDSLATPDVPLFEEDLLDQEIAPLVAVSGQWPFSLRVPNGDMSFSEPQMIEMRFDDGDTWSTLHFEHMLRPAGTQLEVQVIIASEDNRVAILAGIDAWLQHVSDVLDLTVTMSSAPRTYDRVDLDALQEDRGIKKRLGAWLGLADSSDSLPIFFVSSIPNADAFSHGLPTPRSMPGQAGVFLAADDLIANPGRLRNVLAHEIGHALGLPHTSEFDGTLKESFGDTPNCSQENDANKDGALQLAECVGKGAENLMFYQVTASPRTLSASQKAFLKSSPWVK